MPEWIPLVVAILGSVGGAYLGVKVALASLEARIAYLEREVGLSSDEGLRGARHMHAQFIQDHENRLTNLDGARK